MNSPRTTTEPKIFSRKQDLEEAILEFVKKRNPADQPVLLSFAGGSASGKTTIAKEIFNSLGNDAAVLLSQDLFQLGKNFAHRKTSPYKWDDPGNFDLEDCIRSIMRLKSGKIATVPNFDVITNMRHGTTVIESRPIILWEGIYAALTPALREQIDCMVYIDVPFALRILRRLSRFLSRPVIDDMSVPARQMLTFVLLADNRYVASQKEYANFILKYRPDQIDDEIEVLQMRALNHADDMAGLPPHTELLQMFNYMGLRFKLYHTAFAVTNSSNGMVLYNTNLEREITGKIRNDWSKIFDEDYK